MGEITRRRFIGYGAGVGAAPRTLPWTLGTSTASAAMGGKLTKYVQPLPLPGAGIVVATPERAEHVLVHPDADHAAAASAAAADAVWAYDDGSGLGGQAGSFGMAVVAQSGTPLDVSFTQRPAGDVSGLDPGRHAADAARQRRCG